jgi:hypothetical protein
MENTSEKHTGRNETGLRDYQQRVPFLGRCVAGHLCGAGQKMTHRDAVCIRTMVIKEMECGGSHAQEN